MKLNDGFTGSSYTPFKMGLKLIFDGHGPLTKEAVDAVPPFVVPKSPLKDVLNQVRTLMSSYVKSGIKIDDDGLDLLNDESLDNFLDGNSLAAINNSFVRINLLIHALPLLDAAEKSKAMPAPEVCDLRKRLCLVALRNRIGTAPVGSDLDCLEDFFSMIETTDWKNKEALSKFVFEVQCLTDAGY